MVDDKLSLRLLHTMKKGKVFALFSIVWGLLSFLINLMLSLVNVAKSLHFSHKKLNEKFTGEIKNTFVMEIGRVSTIHRLACILINVYCVSKFILINFGNRYLKSLFYKPLKISWKSQNASRRLLPDDISRSEKSFYEIFQLLYNFSTLISITLITWIMLQNPIYSTAHYLYQKL